MLAIDIERNVKKLVAECAEELFASGPSAGQKTDPRAFEVEPAKDPKHGDLAANAAMKFSAQIGAAPMDAAKSLSEKIKAKCAILPWGRYIEKIEAAPPGFINFTFSRRFFLEVLGEIGRERGRYGKPRIGGGRKVLLEFVSANPTGPLTVPHGRQAAVGDSLANILTFAGYRVIREYYLNDEGAQIDMLGASLKARYLERLGRREPFPENGYRGSYMYDIADDLKRRYGERLSGRKTDDFFSVYAYMRVLKGIKKDLADFGVRFDIWYSQRGLRASGKLREALGILRKKGYLYESEGAVWFKSTAFGDDKDRVIIKKTGEYTYLAPDIAYHLYKFRRRFDRLIDIWGPDHHGYIPRLKAAIEALGYGGGRTDILIIQLATLYRAGQPVQMSTRAGEFVSLRDLMDEVGRDAARFFLLMRKRDSHLDLDLELAKKESMDNPVYYVQYAHARISSILDYKKASGRGACGGGRVNIELLNDPTETAVMRTLSRFPFVIESCVNQLEAMPLTTYLRDLASAFHTFYNKLRVVTDDAELTEARLYLCRAIKSVLAAGMELLGISHPEKM